MCQKKDKNVNYKAIPGQNKLAISDKCYVRKEDLTIDVIQGIDESVVSTLHTTDDLQRIFDYIS